MMKKGNQLLLPLKGAQNLSQAGKMPITYTAISKINIPEEKRKYVREKLHRNETSAKVPDYMDKFLNFKELEDALANPKHKKSRGPDKISHQTQQHLRKKTH